MGIVVNPVNNAPLGYANNPSNFSKIYHGDVHALPLRSNAFFKLNGEFPQCAATAPLMLTNDDFVVNRSGRTVRLDFGDSRPFNIGVILATIGLNLHAYPVGYIELRAGAVQAASWLNRLPTIYGGCLAYVSCLAIIAMVFGFAQGVIATPWSWVDWIEFSLIAALSAGILLRYLYVQQQLVNRQQAESQARIESLQARIRPHFLFNCMNTIASLIHVDPAAAEKTVEDLSELFRSNLQKPDLVPLKEEIDLCERYIRIETMRLGEERLTVNWQRPQQLPETLVPSLLLQPLIENAIIHGIQRPCEWRKSQYRDTCQPGHINSQRQ